MNPSNYINESKHADEKILESNGKTKRWNTLRGFHSDVYKEYFGRRPCKQHFATFTTQEFSDAIAWMHDEVDSL